ncbi:MAG: EfeM/EfeO family lipoprotein [Thermomicrobiales bacterium]|nr:EfeM/EfeO family lipoprotein [Thermomicrobiales bacterium]
MLQSKASRRYYGQMGAKLAVAAALAQVPLRAGAMQADATAESGTTAAQVAITLTSDNGGTCSLDTNSVPAGPITFTVTNVSATSLTEVELISNNRILGEKENLAPGLPAVSFTLTLGGGTYQIYCPGASDEMQDFVVTGEAAPKAEGGVTAVLEEGTVGYKNYVVGVIDAMVTAVSTLNDNIVAGDLEAAKIQYPLARPFYERAESSVEGFVMEGFDATDNLGNLDYLIDMRESNLDPDAGWHGFHAIERDLFEGGEITDDTKALSAELLVNVQLLQTVVADIEFAPEDLANGAAALLEEVQANKITGEEEAYSHYDLIDFAANVEGAQQAFAFLEPGMEMIDQALTDQVNTEFENVLALLKTYRDDSIPGGYILYTPEVRDSEGPTLSKAVQLLQEPLARIAEKVATAV